MSASTAPVIDTHGLAKTYKGVQALQPLELIEAWLSGLRQSQ
jgi:hypothetical protein